MDLGSSVNRICHMNGGQAWKRLRKLNVADTS